MAEIFPSAEEFIPVIQADPGTKLASLVDDEIISLYKTAGALLFRGFGPYLRDFQQFTQRFCATAVKNDSLNRAILDPENDIQSVDRGNGALPLHPELSREPWKPDVCFFFCISAPRKGGQTTICDGIKVVERLDPELRDAMIGRRIVYLQNAPPSALEFWFGKPDLSDEELNHPPSDCPYTFQRFGDRVGRLFDRPFLHKPMFCDQLAFGNFLLFAREGGETRFPLLDDLSLIPDEWFRAIKRESQALTIKVEWQDGDLLMLDNSRFMHGRTRVESERERQIATIFGYLRFAEPNPEEPKDPVWRRGEFNPPAAVGNSNRQRD